MKMRMTLRPIPAKKSNAYSTKSSKSISKKKKTKTKESSSDLDETKSSKKKSSKSDEDDDDEESVQDHFDSDLKENSVEEDFDDDLMDDEAADFDDTDTFTDRFDPDVMDDPFPMSLESEVGSGIASLPFSFYDSAKDFSSFDARLALIIGLSIFAASGLSFYCYHKWHTSEIRFTLLGDHVEMRFSDSENECFYAELEDF